MPVSAFALEHIANSTIDDKQLFFSTYCGRCCHFTVYIKTMNNLDSSLQAHNKLEKETTNLVLLKDRVDKYHDLSTQMSSILTIFEKRLGNLEQTILPVYQETEQLQKRQQSE